MDPQGPLVSRYTLETILLLFINIDPRIYVNNKAFLDIIQCMDGESSLPDVQWEFSRCSFYKRYLKTSAHDVLDDRTISMYIIVVVWVNCNFVTTQSLRVLSMCVSNLCLSELTPILCKCFRWRLKGKEVAALTAAPAPPTPHHLLTRCPSKRRRKKRTEKQAHVPSDDKCTAIILNPMTFPKVAKRSRPICEWKCTF